MIILNGERRRIVSISELNAEKKMEMQLAPNLIVRRIELDNKKEILFIG
jgi:hypothetical protein